jgi:hypothetical protein
MPVSGPALATGVVTQANSCWFCVPVRPLRAMPADAGVNNFIDSPNAHVQDHSTLRH